MWSYKYTSSESMFVDQARVGVRLEAATATSQLVDVFSAAAMEPRCKTFFFDTGTEKALGPRFKALLTRPDRDRKALFVGLTFAADFPFHRSLKATTQRVSSFISALGIGNIDMLVIPWPAAKQGHRALTDRGERQRDGELFLKSWRSLQRLVEAGTVRSLGSNDFEPWQLDFVVSQPGPRLVANFIPVSLRIQKRRLTSYCHARQVEVVGSLDTAEIRMAPAADNERQDAAIINEDSRHDGGSIAPEAGVTADTPEGIEVIGGISATQESETIAEIAVETNLTAVQVVTSWAMHRGLVTLHTAGSLGSQQPSPPLATSRSGGDGRDGKSAVTALGSRVREAFSLLHPLASRPSFYSPNKMFDFQLSAPQLDAIEAVDKDVTSTL